MSTFVRHNARQRQAESEKERTAAEWAEDRHTVSFAKAPEKAGEVLRILHGRLGSPNRYIFMDQLETFVKLKPPPKEAAWDALLHGGLVSRLFEVVLDPVLWPVWFENDYEAVRPHTCCFSTPWDNELV